MKQLADQTIAEYYESKTQTIIRRYGPGPRIHYHTGIVDEFCSIERSTEVLRQELVASQERALCYAAACWRVQSTRFNDVIDMGCGLGGGSIFWAEKFGAYVTAVTNVPSHVEWVQIFAEQAGMGARVRPVFCDASQVPGERRFDAAIAVDTSSSLPRKAWFQRLAGLLRAGGHVFIYDCFLERSEYEHPFNRHWRAQIGTIAEYLAAARGAGFRLQLIDDISARTKHFWSMTLALVHSEARERMLSCHEFENLEESLHVHSLMREGLTGGGLRYVLLSFAKE
jgi:SAM-dependent methyltransferase